MTVTGGSSSSLLEPDLLLLEPRDDGLLEFLVLCAMLHHRPLPARRPTSHSVPWVEPAVLSEPCL